MKRCLVCKESPGNNSVAVYLPTIPERELGDMCQPCARVYAPGIAASDIIQEALWIRGDATFVGAIIIRE